MRVGAELIVVHLAQHVPVHKYGTVMMKLVAKVLVEVGARVPELHLDREELEVVGAQIISVRHAHQPNYGIVTAKVIVLMLKETGVEVIAAHLLAQHVAQPNHGHVPLSLTV